jgi:hypothetical protein
MSFPRERPHLFDDGNTGVINVANTNGGKACSV